MSVSFKIQKNSLSKSFKEKILSDVTIENTFKAIVLEDKETSFKISLPFFYGKNTFNTFLKDEIKEPNYSNISLRDYQKEIKDEALTQLSNFNCTTIEIPPGKGKTVLGTYLSSCINLFPILIVYPGTISSLADQWYKTITEKLKEDSVYILKEPSKERKDKVDYSLFKFVICSDKRVSCFSFKKLFKTLIIDEAHLFYTEKKLFSVFFNLEPKYIISLTATLERNDNLHQMHYLLCGQHTIKRNPDIPFEVKILNTEVTDIKLEFNKKTNKLDFLKYCKDLSDNIKYNEFILDIVKKNLDRKFIILTKFIDHAHFLSNLFFTKENIKTAILCGKLKNHYDERVLIGTIPKLSTGYDAEGASINYSGEPADSLIFAHPVKQYQLFEQCKGRIMRTKKNPIIYCLKIPKLNFSTKHITDLKEYIIQSKGIINYN